MSRRPPSRHAGRGARIVLGLVAASALLGAGPALASTHAADAAAPTAATLGGYSATAASSPIHVTYNPVGLLPTGAPVDLGAPDALATIASGPSTFARASNADPGDLIANPDALLAQATSAYKAGTIPAYPYRVSASSGVGDPSAESNPAPGLNARVTAKDTGSTAEATMPGLATPGVVTAGSLIATATTITDGATVTVHARTTIGDVDIAGVVHLNGIVTDLVASSNGGEPTLTGGTKVTGATLAGTPITIDDKGVRAAAGGVDVNSVLKALGIAITLPGKVALEGDEAGQLASTGLRIDIAATSALVPGLDDILDGLPPIEPVAPGVPGVEDVLAVARARHLSTIELGRGQVAITASPDVPIPEVPVVTPPADPGAVPTDPGVAPFMPTEPLADPVVAPAPAAVSPLAPAAPIEPVDVSVGTGIGALAALVLLLQPFLGDRLARVANAQVGTDEEGCPWERR